MRNIARVPKRVRHLLNARNILRNDTDHYHGQPHHVTIVIVAIIVVSMCCLVVVMMIIIELIFGMRIIAIAMLAGMFIIVNGEHYADADAAEVYADGAGHADADKYIDDDDHAVDDGCGADNVDGHG